MPLPEPGSPWPPRPWRPIYGKYNEWSAWYAGDTEELAAIYGESTGNKSPFKQTAERSHGFLGKVARWFWGTPPSRNLSTKLHVPAASDIAETSANLMFAEPPSVRLAQPTTDEDGGDTRTQDRLDELMGPDTVVTLQEAAEVASGLSGVFLRGTWDREVVPDRPFPTAIHPDSAIPTFRWGRLVEVTFHREVHRDGDRVWRHLEHHAPGVIQHALYEGDPKVLGVQRALDDMPATEGLAAESEDGMTVLTGIDQLDVVYVPNVTPTRIWRNSEVGSALGRSDFEGVEPFLDALDEAYTSWRRDIRLAKSRLIVPDSYLETFGRGQGAGFDNDQEIFTPLNMVEDSPNAGITANQFAIRHEEHRATCLDWWEKIVRGAGYSAQTFGLTSEVAMTATETNAKERKTLLTRSKKTRLWTMGLERLAEILLALDRAQFNSNITPQQVEVEFAPAVTEQMGERAATVQALNDAEAASTEVKVRMAHPDWDADRVQAEVDAIQAERPAPPDMGLPPEPVQE